METLTIKRERKLRPRTSAGRLSIDEPRADAIQGPLGAQLLGANLLTAEQLNEALEAQQDQGRRLGEILLDLGVLNEDQLLPFMQRQLGWLAIRLREGLIDPAVVQLIPEPVARRLGAVAMFRVRGRLCVALDEPQDLRRTDEIARVTGLNVRPVFAFRSDVDRMLDRCYADDFQVDEVTADMADNELEIREASIEVALHSLDSLVEGSPIINLVNYLILQAIRQSASDIHVEPGRAFTVVRFRIDGQLHEVLRPRADIHGAIVSRIKVMGKMDIAEHWHPQDGRCQVAAERKQVDLRISTIPTVLGEKVVIRVLDKQNLTFDLHDLGIPPNLLAEIKKLLAKPYGLFLVTGPTGSGKTTTLYSALELIKSVHSNIVTVEDPVEYQIELVNQVPVDESRNMTFSGALRAILRQDPDIVMIGEIRDAETAQIALQAALTGHLVLSTLHTNDSPSAIVRLTDMGLAPYKVAAALVGVVAQRLVRRICPNCRTSYFPPAELLNTIRYDGDRRRKFVRGEGCADCFDTGFLGRTGIYEVMPLDRKLRELVAAGATLEQIRTAFIDNGGRSLLQEGIRLAEQEVTSLDEVMRVAFFE